MTKMDSIDVPRVLSILGAVAEAATTDELLGAVLEASVALVHADTAVVTEIGGAEVRQNGAMDIVDCAVDIQDNAGEVQDSAVDIQDSAGEVQDRAVVTRDRAHLTRGNVMVTAVGPSGSRVKTWPEDFLSVSQQLAFEQLHTKTPWPLATHTRLGDGRPLRISDLFSQRHYRSLEIYGELFRVLGFDHQVAFSIPIEPDRCICVAMNRQGGDFSASELDRLEALRRPVAACASRIALEERFDVPGVGGTACLTPREHDVVTLVATGLSNAQIGLRLGISARTVNKHLEHIFAKTGLSNRTEVAAWWPRILQRRSDPALPAT